MVAYGKLDTESKREKVKSVQDPEKILRIIRNYYTDSRDSLKRRERIDRSISNNAAFNGYFDFSDKVEGQSCESLPKVTTAVESFSAFIRRGLAQYGEWFRVDMPLDPLLSPEDVSKLLKEYLRDMPDGELGTKSIDQVLSDGAKCGALDSLVAFKVHGSSSKRKRPHGVQGDSKERWRLAIDLMPIEDYFPDPTGRKLYEIHAKQVDLFTVMRAAEAGAYDKAQVDMLKGSLYGQDQDTDKDQLNRDEVRTTSSRATVKVQEFYGTLVDSDGTLVEEDVYACVANEKHLLSGPKPIKAWCGSPFAVGPLTRVPHSVWHRAVMDYVSDLNQSLNELYNLIFDAGVSSVHGVKEIRLSWLEDPGSVAG
ncbi:MAG: portal protein, partial [Nitrososphaera sp.]